MLCWKIIHNAIPVDSIIQACGIPLASMCNCCISNRNMEDLNHLFLSSEITNYLWRRFGDLFNRNILHLNSIQDRIWGTLGGAVTSKPIGYISSLVLLMMIWEIWVARCKKKFDSSFICYNKISDNIINSINSCLKHKVFNQSMTKPEIETLKQLGICCVIQIRTPFLVRWIPPSEDFVLNVDGACKGNPGKARGGGCIRDKYGKLKLAFSYYYGIGTNTIAETRALLDGIRLAQYYNIKLSGIFSDSQVVVNKINKNTTPPWSLLPWWDKIINAFRDNDYHIKHVYRESNCVADCLASHAVETDCLASHEPNDRGLGC